MRYARPAFILVHLALVVWLLASVSNAQGKNPVILVPGLIGSELRHRDTNELVWFRALKPSSGDLRLPVTTNPRESRDDLVHGDVIREVKVAGFPFLDIYAGFIKAMRVRGGYFEEKWRSPSEQGAEDSLYVFPYDWRLDNVDNARLLVREVQALRTRLKKPEQKFDIVAHSMGGLISRYAVMYGDEDLPAGNKKPVPTWAGAELFDRVILLGTPNDGAVGALNGLVNGYAIGGIRIDLPFLQSISRFTLFTVPTAYQLLPAPNALVVYDESLKPLAVDLYDPKAWSQFGWNPIDDPGFAKEFPGVKKADAEKFFEASLARAKRFHEALAAVATEPEAEFHVIGADCRPSPHAILIHRDGKSQRWKTTFEPKGFTRSDGTKVTDNEVKNKMLSPGDGVVSFRSLSSAVTLEKNAINPLGRASTPRLICGEHYRLASNARVQDQVIDLLRRPPRPRKTEEH